MGDTAVILAGGQSSRFGSPKGMALFHGERVIDREIRILKKIFTEVLIVSQETAFYGGLVVPVIPDREPGQGPMEGIVTAFDGAPASERIFVAGCDLPLLDAGFIKILMTNGNPHGMEEKGAQQATIPLYGGRQQYLHAVYHRSLRDTMDNYLKKGGRALKDFLLDIHVALIPCETSSCASFNTPEELADLEGTHAH